MVALEIPDRTNTDTDSHEVVDPISENCCLVQIYPADVVDGMQRLVKDTLVIGRDHACDLSLPDGNVSRRHAQLRRVGDVFEITDLGSTNGTIVNGKRVETAVLSCGDCVKLGGFLFKFLSADSIEAVYHETVYSALTIDALTGAFNKKYLLDNLQREIARSTRHGRPLVVVMTDIDRFKSVNDTYGHLVGDEVLREFGRRFSEVSRDGDLFARYGGEEFCLLMTETYAEEAFDIAERCRVAIASEPFATASGPLEVTASFGLDVYTGGGATCEQLIGAADRRLYQAKAEGRNRVIGPQ